jgi:truncated hemoglobin YjbI
MSCDASDDECLERRAGRPHGEPRPAARPQVHANPRVCEVTGGPFQFSAIKPGKTHLRLEEAHRDLKITPEEFEEVAAELGRSLDFAKVPEREKREVLAAFAAHKKEVTAGSMQK